MELLRALGRLAEPPSPESAALAEALGLGDLPTASEYTELFHLNLYPYAAVYVDEHGMLGGDAHDRIAGFWRALGLVPPAEPDHLAALLGLYAAVVEGGLPGEARRALLWEHLLPWLPAYLEKTTELAPRFYRDWAELLRTALVAEAHRFPAAGLVPAHLREAAPIADPRQRGLEEFLSSLLASVRSGLVLVRTDLVRAARELGSGLRLGERRFVLRTLLAQDPPGTLDWLTREARHWVERHRSGPSVLVTVTEHWAERARRTEDLLCQLAREEVLAVSDTPVATAQIVDRMEPARPRDRSVS